MHSSPCKLRTVARDEPPRARTARYAKVRQMGEKPAGGLARGGHASEKKHIRPVDMEIIDRVHRSVWTVLNDGKRMADSVEARELSDKVTRKLVEVARDGAIDLDTLRDRALAEIRRHN